MAFNSMGLTKLAFHSNSESQFGKYNRMPSEITFPKLEICENVKC